METTVISVETIEELQTSINGLVEFLEQEKQQSGETNEELQTSINGLVEFLEQEKQQNEENEQQQIEIFQNELENGEYFRDALLNSLNEVNTTLLHTKSEVLEMKESLMELSEVYMQAVPNFYWGANALIILVCIIPCLIIIKLFEKMFNKVF